MSRPRRPIPPLDAAALERLALRYVERFATTRGKLTDYLRRKLRERGWDGTAEADPAGIAERMAGLGYIDDRSFAEARVAAMGRRGLGARRIAGALRAAGIAGEDAEAVRDSVAAQARDSAIAYARRRRIGPFATGTSSPDGDRRALAAMLRAGHAYDLSRRILALTDSEFAAEMGNEAF
ncbi:regulatory protein RecX [Sphingomonas sp. RS2018]